MLFSETPIEVYRSIIEYNPDATFVTTVEGNIVDSNEAMTKLFGYSKEEIKDSHCFAMVMPEFIEDVHQQWTKVVQGEPCDYQTVAKHKNGSMLYLDIKNIPLIVGGQVVGVLGVVKDMTALHHAHENLTDVAEKLKALFNYTADAIYLLDVKQNVIDVNPAFEQMYGWTKEEIIGEVLPMIPKSQLNLSNRLFEQVNSGEVIQNFVSTHLKKNGTTIHVNITLSPIRDSKGSVIAISGITRDITVHMQLEKALHESRERYKALVEFSPEPIIVYRQGEIEYANPACMKLFGATALTDVAGSLDFFHPDCVDVISNRLHNYKEIGTVFAPVEQKVIRLDGKVIDVEVTGITINQDGKPALLLMYHDITRRKRAEQALRQSEKNYRLIAENMTDLVCVINWDGSFKYASPSHVTLLGYPSEVYEGHPAKNWMHKDDHPEVRKRLEKTVQKKEACMFEFRYKNRKGNWIWLEGKATPVFDEKDQFQHFLIVSREITERKLLQEKLSHLAYHDPLTGLPNRRLFSERLKQSLKEAQRYQRKLAIMFMDLDGFKHINDTWGHDVGDELLKQFAERVKGCLRESDTLARQGGDEFLILLPEIQEKQDAIHIAKRILSSLQQPWMIGPHILPTTTSIGISFYPQDGISTHELIKQADSALYKAKKDGKNKFKTAL